MPHIRIPFAIRCRIVIAIIRIADVDAVIVVVGADFYVITHLVHHLFIIYANFAYNSANMLVYNVMCAIVGYGSIIALLKTKQFVRSLVLFLFIVSNNSQ